MMAKALVGQCLGLLSHLPEDGLHLLLELDHHGLHLCLEVGGHGLQLLLHAGGGHLHLLLDLGHHGLKLVPLLLQEGPARHARRTSALSRREGRAARLSLVLTEPGCPAPEC